MSDTKNSRDDKKKKNQGKEKDDVRKDLDDILGQLSESEKQKRERTSKEESSKEPEKKGEQTPKSSDVPPEQSEPEDLNQILGKISEKEEEPVEALDVGQRIVSVFTNPIRLFHYLRQKPDYLIPLILTIIISVISSALVYDIAINDQIKRIENSENIPADRKDSIIDSINSSRFGIKRIIYGYVFPGIGVLITFAIVSAIFLFIGNVILGGKAKYVQVFSAYCYSYLVVAIVGTAVKLPLWLTQNTLRVDVSPAVFLPDASMQSSLYRFVSSFDIFTLWFLIVFGVGFSVIYRFSQLKGLISVITAWLIYVVITKVLLGSFAAGLMG